MLRLGNMIKGSACLFRQFLVVPKPMLHTPRPQQDASMASSLLQFRVECRRTKPGQAVYIVGSAPELGTWKVEEGAEFQN